MLEKDCFFVTGGTGFVGAAVVRALLSKGYGVRALARKGSDRRNLDGLAVDVIEGDYPNPETYASALRGCKGLFHVAADYRIWVPDEAAMHRVNVDGTRHLLLAAHEAGIRRMVYTSSVATLGLRSDGIPSSEASPSHFKDMVGAYKRSKYLAEEEVRRLIRHHGVQVVIVNPSTPIGPRDIKPTPTGQIVVDAMSGRMPAYVDTGLNVVHVDDVAMGHWLAFEKGLVGERYILGGENLSLAEILAMIATMAGRAAPKIKLPRWPLYPIAFGMEMMAGLTGRTPRVTVDALRMARKKMFFSSLKAERDLGYRARPARLAIADAMAWFKEHGYSQ